MNKSYVLGGAALLLLAGFFILKAPALQGGSLAGTNEKVYVALEGDGAVTVLDGVRGKVLKTISLDDTRTGTRYMPHNVQVSPDGSVVWVTANAMAGMDHQSFRLINVAYADAGHEDSETISDQVIVIDPKTDTIVRRIPISIGAHLAHVVQSAQSSTVFIAAQEEDKIYLLDAKTLTLSKSIDLPKGSGPHGMRLSPDGKTIYVALTGGKSLGVVDVVSGVVETVALDGGAVQTAVTPDGSRVAVSVYDSRSVGVYNVARKALAYVRLPNGSQGPVQLYSTNDSRYVYVADQGVLGGRGVGNKLYKIDLESLSIVETIAVGDAPHGVSLNSDGSRVYVTNLKGNSVSVVDTSSALQVALISVGDEPNGISVWNGEKSAANMGLLHGVAITVYKSPTCGCCGNYIAELRRQGASVDVKEISDAEMTAKKRELGVPQKLESCHTSIIDGYVIEGHVPMEAVARLLSERPAIKGIALPGMPAGSPGMSGVKTGPFEVQTLEGALFGKF